MSEYSVELAAKIEELRRCLESKTVECPMVHAYDGAKGTSEEGRYEFNNKGIHWDVRGEVPCSFCRDFGAKGRIHNPATVPLMGVVSYYSEHHEACVQATANTGVG